jgi:hypothetical protein
MTPKEHAKLLYGKFYGIPLYIKTVKECCNIAVNELLNEYPAQCPEDSYEKERYLYWKEVKQEIEKL